MKKTWKIIYVVSTVCVMAAPFAGMAFFRTDTTTENKRMAEMPNISENGSINKDYLNDLGTYLNDHFAFRNYLVDADSRIQSGVFGESNVDTVLVGTDGWLYYTATIDNYLGQNRMSERTLNNCVRNIKLMQDYVKSRGAKFVLAVPPNKNALYGENMPYYDSHKVSDGSDMDILSERFVADGVNYADLYSVLKSQSEIMYLKRDSHWNNAGALLAYNSILDAADVEHDSYETAHFTRKKDYVGDLNSMIYPVSSRPEWNVYIEGEFGYTYTTDTKSVEDIQIGTANPDGKGSLLMFRDSFGNTLLPYMANAFEEGFFSKSIPYNIAGYMQDNEPDVVVVEKVQRNIKEFATDPAVFQGPEVEGRDGFTDAVGTAGEDNGAAIDVCEAESNVNFWQIDGQVSADMLGADGNVSIAITSGDETKVYEAFGLTNADSDYGYRLYLDKNSVATDKIDVSVYVDDGQNPVLVAARSVELSDVDTLN